MIRGTNAKAEVVANLKRWQHHILERQVEEGVTQISSKKSFNEDSLERYRVFKEISCPITRVYF